MNTVKNVVLFLTQNQKLCGQLQNALKGFVVLKAENIEAVNNAVKHGNAVGAVVLHITNSNNWIIFELLKTGYPDVPRFAVLSPSTSNDSYKLDELAAKNGAAAIINEKQGIASLAPLIQNIVNAKPPEESDTKSAYLVLFGDVSREIARIQKDFTTTALRTLPQPEIGKDSQDRLEAALNKLKAIRINP